MQPWVQQGKALGLLGLLDVRHWTTMTLASHRKEYLHGFRLTRGQGSFEGSLKFFQGRLIRLRLLNQKPELFHEHLPCLGLRLRCSELVFRS